MGGAENGKLGAVRGGRGMGAWESGGACGGVQGSRGVGGGGLGVENAYRWRGEREARCLSRGEGDADLGRRWRVWRRWEERGLRWRGLGVADAYRRRGNQEARCCL